MRCHHHVSHTSYTFIHIFTTVLVHNKNVYKFTDIHKKFKQKEKCKHLHKFHQIHKHFHTMAITYILFIGSVIAFK